MVGLIPLFAVMTLEPELMEKVPGFYERVEWFIENRRNLRANVACMRTLGDRKRRLLSIVWKERLSEILAKLLDEKEFLGEYGIRAISRYHQDHPYCFAVNGDEYRVDYEPAESSSGLFGGNSNWRGPVWFPVNFLLIESLQKFHHYLGPDFKVECPTGSGKFLNLWEVAAEIEARLIGTFLQNDRGHRPVFGANSKFQTDPHRHDYLLYFEYFHGDNGMGIGASHQTGWTGWVAKLIQQYAQYQPD